MTSLVTHIRQPRTVSEDLGASLTAQGIEVAARLLQAVERGCFPDVLSLYQRLLLRIGRSISDAPAMRDATNGTRTIFTLAATKREDRIVIREHYLLPALCGLLHDDAERHWRIADALIKGWCLAEAVKHREIKVNAAKYLPDDTTAEVIEQLQLAHEAEAVTYERLANGEGWA